MGRVRTMGLGLILVGWVVGSLAMAAQGSAAGVAVEGVDRVRLLAPAGAEVSPYENSGYSLRWVDDEVVIEVDASPLVSSSRFVLPTVEAGDPIARLARGVTAGAETHYEAISRVLGWVARHIEYNLDREQSQAATAVLERRSGYCTGVARLTVALLRSVGVEAREVAGYVVGSGSEQPRGYHRWIEAFLPDRGWVFSDPLSTHHYVPATYVRLASEELMPEQGIEGLLLERQDRVDRVDLFPAAAPGITARRNTDRQLAAALRVQVEDHSRGVAILAGRSVRRTHTLIDGVATFIGLEPGYYQLDLMVPGWGFASRRVELSGRVRKTLSLTGSSGHPTDGTQRHGAEDARGSADARGAETGRNANGMRTREPTARTNRGGLE